MNREIKFRGKSLNTNCWVYGDLRQDKIRGKAYIEYEVDPDTVGQYTGLKDKNGKEIFEGDIVTTNKDDFFAIEYREEEAAFKMIDYGTAPLAFDIHELTKKEINEQRIKVVGNIQDNPETLKGVK